jgi:hypothetical protein
LTAASEPRADDDGRLNFHGSPLLDMAAQNLLMIGNSDQETKERNRRAAMLFHDVKRAIYATRPKFDKYKATAASNNVSALGEGYRVEMDHDEGPSMKENGKFKRLYEAGATASKEGDSLPSGA